MRYNPCLSRIFSVPLLALACAVPGRATTDKIDFPFKDDPAVVGTWRSVACLDSPEAFSPQDGPATGLSLKELVFLPQGKTPRPSQTWTQGVLINSPAKTASHYTFKDIDGLKYMFIEWKTGDYVNHDMPPQYCVLVRDSDYAKLPKPRSAQEGPEAGRYEDCLVKLPPGGVCRRPQPSVWRRQPMDALPHYTGKQWQIDLRERDIAKLDLAGRSGDLNYADFNSATRFPKTLPEGFDPQRIMALGKDPGLGVRRLHQDGITGSGVGIAILDQALLTEHVEYADRLRFYEEIHNKDRSAAMHGPAVASIAAGKTVGVAPGADLYFIAMVNGEAHGRDFAFDLSYVAQGIERILEVNRTLPKGQKIRVISISLAMMKDFKNHDQAVLAIAHAEKDGVLVLTVDNERFKFDGMDRLPLADPERPDSYSGGLMFCNNREGAASDTLQIPMDSRTYADPSGPHAYAFSRIGGQSWIVPWVAGLYALACQARPDVTPELFWKTALETAKAVDFNRDGKTYRLAKVVDPVSLIARLKSR